MPFPQDVLEIHAAKLKRRAQREGVAFGPELAVQSVYEISEPIAKLLSDKWARPPGNS
jgi:glutamate mutase epsilon subunit